MNQEVAGGSRSVPTRKEVIRKKLSAENNDMFQKIDPEYGSKKSHLFMYPHLDHGLEAPLSYQMKPLDFYWLLTRELSIVIRGAVRLVDNFTYQVPSIDTPGLSKKRTKEAKIFTENVPCYYFQGSLSQITDFVHKQVEQSLETAEIRDRTYSNDRK